MEVNFNFEFSIGRKLKWKLGSKVLGLKKFLFYFWSLL